MPKKYLFFVGFFETPARDFWKSDIWEILGEILALDSAEEFSNICTSHSDYMWNIAH